LNFFFFDKGRKLIMNLVLHFQILDLERKIL